MTKAQRAHLLDELISRGFDKSRESVDSDGIRVRCSQCEALVINGLACHETGCPNVVHEVPDDDGYLDDPERFDGME